MKVRLLFQLFLILCSRANTSVSRQFSITNSQQFVIVDADQPQRYRLFGYLPYPDTIYSQIIITAIIAIAVGLPTLLYFLLRPTHPYADWTSRLPDSLVRLLYYLQLEVAESKNHLIAQVMSDGNRLGYLVNVESTWHQKQTSEDCQRS
jgi:short subunit fatty acids transporter